MKVPTVPIIHTTFVVAILVSMAFLTSLVTFNFVVLKKMDDVEAVVKNFLDSKFMGIIKPDFASKIIRVFDENRQLMATTQTLAFLILIMLSVRLCVLFLFLYPPKKESMFSVLRRPHEELESRMTIK